MSQQNLEILSDERIAPSLLKSEYAELIASADSIAVEDSLDSADSLVVEYPLDSEYFLDSGYSFDSGYSLDSENFLISENPLLFQELEVDSLTGVANNPTVDARFPFPIFEPPAPPALQNAKLQIDLFGSNWNQAKVTVTIQVVLNRSLVSSAGGIDSLVLKTKALGIDGNLFNGRNDHLFDFSDQKVTGSGTYTYSKIVPRSLLNEDRSWFNRDDEIAARINLVSSNTFSLLNRVAMTPMIRGYF